MEQRPQEVSLVVVRDLNANILEPEGNRRDEAIAAALSDAGLDKVLGHLLLCSAPWTWDGRTWSMPTQVSVVRSPTDYIISIDRCLLHNGPVQDPRHNIYHWVFLGCLHGDSQREHQRYLGRRTQHPLRPPTVPTREDVLFTDIRQSITKPHRMDRWRTPWISDETWIAMESRVALCRAPTYGQARTRTLGRRIKVLLNRYRQIIAAEDV